MRVSMLRMNRIGYIFLGILCISPAHGQGRPPAPVIVSDVIEQKVQNEIGLVGTVQPRRSSLIASETEGQVVMRFKEAGQSVRRNEAVFRLDNDELRAGLVEARADVELQEFNHTQSKQLLRTEAVSEQDLRNAEYQLARAQAKLQDLESRVKAMDIAAPFPGHIVQTMTEVGEWVSRGEGVFRLISTDTVRVYVNVPEKYVDRLRLGDETDVIVDALGTAAFKARIVAILAEGYADAHTFPVVVEFRNPDGRIRSNMSARVVFRIEQPGAAVLVHKDALINTPYGQVVYLAVDDKAVRRNVEPGLAYQDYVAVSGDLKPGDQAIVRGNERLQDGQPINVIRKLQ